MTRRRRFPDIATNSWRRTLLPRNVSFAANDIGGRRHDMAIIVAAALLFRLALSTQDIAYHADEVWQYLEPAYGLVTGHWIVTWEYHAQIRGWLVPMMLAPMVALGHALAPATRLDIWLVRAVLSLVSLGVVVAFADLGSRISRQHGIVAAWVAAIWVEIFYFAPRCSAEAMSVSLLVPAIALLYRLRGDATARTALFAGFLFGLGAIVRFQYLPAIVLVAGWTVWRHARAAWCPLLLGACLAFTLGALADVANGQVPLLWIYTNNTINLGQNRSAFFGTAAPDWYVLQMCATWGWCMPIIVPAAMVGARRLPMVAGMALAIIGMHMLVPHKEYRFILLAVVLLILLAAIGSVDVANFTARRYPSYRRWTKPSLAVLWFAMSLMVALCKPFAGYWSAQRSMLLTLVNAGERADLCGLAYFHPPSFPRASYAYLNRDVPILLFDGPAAAAQAAANQSRFNVVIAPGLAASELPPAYRLDHCMAANKPLAGQADCTFVRHGSCRGGAGDFAYNLVLTRQGY